MTDLMLRYRLVKRGATIINPGQLLVEASVDAAVTYIEELDFYSKLCNVSYDETTYTEQQVLDALAEADPEVVTDGGAAFKAEFDVRLSSMQHDVIASCQFDPAGFESFYSPIAWVKIVGVWLAELPPYFADRRAANGYEALSPDDKTVFESKFIVGGVNRWTVLYNLIVYIREIFTVAPADWAAWDAAHPDVTKAHLTEILETIYTWSK